MIQNSSTDTLILGASWIVAISGGMKLIINFFECCLYFLDAILMVVIAWKRTSPTESLLAQVISPQNDEITCSANTSEPKRISTEL